MNKFLIYISTGGLSEAINICLIQNRILIIYTERNNAFKIPFSYFFFIKNKNLIYYDNLDEIVNLKNINITTKNKLKKIEYDLDNSKYNFKLIEGKKNYFFLNDKIINDINWINENEKVVFFGGGNYSTEYYVFDIKINKIIYKQIKEEFKLFKSKNKTNNYLSDTTKCIQIYTSSKIKNIHININI